MPGKTMQPTIVFEPHIPTALQRALEYAGNKGGVGSEGDYFYGYDSDYGIGGYAHMVGMARYVAVAPRAAGSGGLRGRDFERGGNTET